MRIVFAFKECPAPAERSGSRLRASTVLKALEAAGHSVRLVYFTDPGDPVIPGALAVPRPPGGLRRRLQDWIAPGVPLFRPNYESVRMRRALEEAAVGADAVILGQDQMAIYREVVGHLPCVLDATDAWPLVIESIGRNWYLRAHRERIRKYIRQHYCAFDAVLVVSERDAVELKRIDIAINTRIVPHAVDTGKVVPGGTEAKAPTVVCVGVMNHAPNVTGVTRFVRQIWPRIRAQVPEAVFRIVGRDPVRSVRALAGNGVEVVGGVPSVLPYLQEAWVSVCPVWSGAGMKTKVLESMAAGKPVVATPEGGTGIFSGIRVRESAMSFAEAVLELLRDRPRRKREGAKARKVVEKEYSWKSVEGSLTRILDTVVVSSARSA